MPLPSDSGLTGGQRHPSVPRGSFLELAFQEKRLRGLCEDDWTAQNELGADTASLLLHRVADIRAATSVLDLVAGSPREDGSTVPSSFLVNVAEKHRIRIAANHVSNPITPTGAVDWANVRRVMIVAIEASDE